MALINCKECGKEISEFATSCPHCGLPLASEISNQNNDVVFQQNNNTNQSESGMGIAGLVLGCLGIIPLFAILGFIFSIIGLSSKTKKSICGTIGIILSGLFLIIWIIR